VKNINTILAVGAVTAVCGGVEAAVVAAWDFQTITNGGTALAAPPNTPKVISANFGAGTIYLDGTNGSSNFFQPASGTTNTEINAFSGTSVNADVSIGMSTVTTTGALAIVGGLTPSGGTPAANGKSMAFKFNMSNLANLSFTFAAQRTATGFTGIVIETSTDGSAWNAWTTLTSTNAGTGTSAVYSGPIKDSFVNSGVISVASTTTLDNATSAYVRFTFSGATASTGNNRFDNFIFSADAIPAPGALALLGVAGLLGSRRRR